MTPRALRFVSASFALLLLGGCDQPCVEAIQSEQGQLGFDDPFSVGLPTPFSSGDAVVEGSVFCPDVRQWYEGPQRTCVAISAGPEAWFDPCWERRVDGPADPTEGGCLQLGQRGLVTWSFEPTACDVEVEIPEFGPDALVFDVRDVESLEARMLWWFEERAESAASPGPEPGFPEDWLDPIGAEIRVVEGGEFWPVLGLREPGVSERVAYTDGVIRSDAPQGEVAIDPQGRPRTPVLIQSGDRARLDLELEAGVVEGPTLLGVPQSEVASVSLVAAYEPGRGGEPWGVPMGVRAIVRDREGGLLRASAMQWDVEGDAQLFSAWGDVALLSAPCSPPEAGSGSQSATVAARIGELEQTLELRWTTPVCEDPPEDPFNPDPEPLDFSLCACSTGDEPPGPLGIALAVLVLVRLRPRRR